MKISVEVVARIVVTGIAILMLLNGLERAFGMPGVNLDYQTLTSILMLCYWGSYLGGRYTKSTSNHQSRTIFTSPKS